MNHALDVAGSDVRVSMQTNAVLGLGQPEPKIGPAAYTKRKAAVNELREKRFEDREHGEVIDLLEAAPVQGAMFLLEDSADPKVAAKRRILETLLRGSVTDEFAAQLGFIRRCTDGAWITFKRPPGGIRDSGDKLTAHNMPPEIAAKRIVALANAKGWRRVQFYGPSEFVKEAIRLALEQGMEIVPRDDEQRQMIEQLQNRVTAAVASRNLEVAKAGMESAKAALAALKDQAETEAELASLVPEVTTLEQARSAAARELGGEAYADAAKALATARRTLAAAQARAANAQDGIFHLLERRKLNNDVREAEERMRQAATRLKEARRKISDAALNERASDLLARSQAVCAKRAERDAQKVKLTEQLKKAQQNHQRITEALRDLDAEVPDTSASVEAARRPERRALVP